MTPPRESGAPLLHIPTTIITGFLGSGKTTAINHLLSVKPKSERWAVVVNEFGKIGVDGALLGKHPDVSVKEIAGGCLCCSAGQVFEAGVNRFIRDSLPQRIIIEPTGIGHPLNIIHTLTSGYYRDVLDLKATICLVDARKLAGHRYLENPAFRDQLNLSDVLVASKSDSYGPLDRMAFRNLAARFTPPKSALITTVFGNLDLSLLDIDRNPSRIASFPDAHPPATGPGQSAHAEEMRSHDAVGVAPDSWSMLEGCGAGYFSGSWQAGLGFLFKETALLELLATFRYERIKGVIQCRESWFSINGSAGDHNLSSCAPATSSRLEIIHDSPLPCSEIDRKLRLTLGA
ncbi:MAG: GTP-binding protein [Chlorobiaceae bacterium]